jgi:hypothetical protein
MKRFESIDRANKVQGSEKKSISPLLCSWFLLCLDCEQYLISTVGALTTRAKCEMLIEIVSVAITKHMYITK